MWLRECSEEDRLKAGRSQDWLPYGSSRCLLALWSVSTPPRLPCGILLRLKWRFSRDGGKLFTVCEGTDEVAVVDTRSLAVLRRIHVGRAPKDITRSRPTARHTLCRQFVERAAFPEIDTQSMQLTRSLPTRFRA